MYVPPTTQLPIRPPIRPSARGPKHSKAKVKKENAEHRRHNRKNTGPLTTLNSLRLFHIMVLSRPIPRLKMSLLESVEGIFLFIEVPEREPEGDAPYEGEDGHGAVVPDEEGVGGDGCDTIGNEG